MVYTKIFQRCKGYYSPLCPMGNKNERNTLANIPIDFYSQALYLSRSAGFSSSEMFWSTLLNVKCRFAVRTLPRGIVANQKEQQVHCFSQQWSR